MLYRDTVSGGRGTSDALHSGHVLAVLPYQSGAGVSLGDGDIRGGIAEKRNDSGAD